LWSDVGDERVVGLFPGAGVAGTAKGLLEIWNQDCAKISELLLVESFVLWHLGHGSTLALEGSGVSGLLDDLQQFGDDLGGVGLELGHGLQAVWIFAFVVSEDVLVLWELLEVLHEDVHGVGGDITPNSGNIVSKTHCESVVVVVARSNKCTNEGVPQVSRSKSADKSETE